MQSIGIYRHFLVLSSQPSNLKIFINKPTAAATWPLEIGSGLLESVEVLRVLLRSPPFGDHSRERERERRTAGPSRCMAPVISVCQMCPEKDEENLGTTYARVKMAVVLSSKGD